MTKFFCEEFLEEFTMENIHFRMMKTHAINVQVNMFKKKLSQLLFPGDLREIFRPVLIAYRALRRGGFLNKSIFL